MDNLLRREFLVLHANISLSWLTLLLFLPDLDLIIILIAKPWLFTIMVEFYSDVNLQRQHDKVFQTCTSDSQTLPPNIDAKTFQQVISQLRSIVGEDNVVTGPKLNNFRDPYPLIEEESQASAAVWSGFLL